jgi:transposase
MTTIRTEQSIAVSSRLHLAFELGWNEWKLAFTIGHGQAPRLRTIKARDVEALKREIGKAKERFGLPEDAAVVSCYEAGRDGFWLHRWLETTGVANVVIDSSSIEVNRRRRRAKSDHLDATKLVTMLLRYHSGETKVWSVVKVPSVADEDRRRLHRELRELKDERTGHVNRIKGLLASQGVSLSKVGGDLVEWLSKVRLWDETELGPDSRAELLREFERWQFVDRQIKDVEQARRQRVRCDDTPHVDKVRRLLELSGVGFNGAWLLVMELFAWREIRSRKQLGALVGLTPTPYQSGSSAKEQGISKAGNRQLRQMMVELAWCWVRWQPDSELSQWYYRRFGSGGGRSRKVGIVALARKLLIALWRYLEHGEIPKGAKLCAWQTKAKVKSKAA